MAARSPTPGIFTVSLDFELHWGMRDKVSGAKLEPRMGATREVIPRLLQVFSDYGVHATWATVGFLFCESGEEARELSPEPSPRYARAELSPWDDVEALGRDEAAEPSRLAPSLIALVARTPGQEVGSHTFSHFYCLEDGVDDADFERDLIAARSIAKRRGIDTVSIVFPRNQVAERHVEIADRVGVRVYRGNPGDWMYRARADAEQTLSVRASRLVDAYLPLSGMQTVPLDALASTYPVNVPATRFMRPFSPALAPLEGMRLRRIEREIDFAARRGHLVHLWWHPHNFAQHTERNIAALERVLRAFARARRRHGMRAMNMAEVAAERTGAAPTDPPINPISPGAAP